MFFFRFKCLCLLREGPLCSRNTCPLSSPRSSIEAVVAGGWVVPRSRSRWVTAQQGWQGNGDSGAQGSMRLGGFALQEKSVQGGGASCGEEEGQRGSRGCSRPLFAAGSGNLGDLPGGLGVGGL